MYRNVGTLQALFHLVREAAAKVDTSAKFVFVEDAGDGESLSTLRELAQSDPQVQLVIKPCSLGHQ